jgi:Fe-S cluster assembly scaffold protein SufB
MGDRCGAHTFPYIKVDNKSSIVEHEATTSKISDDQLFYCLQRGIGMEEAVNWFDCQWICTRGVQKTANGICR